MTISQAFCFVIFMRHKIYEIYNQKHYITGKHCIRPNSPVGSSKYHRVVITCGNCTIKFLSIEKRRIFSFNSFHNVRDLCLWVDIEILLESVNHIKAR